MKKLTLIILLALALYSCGGAPILEDSLATPTENSGITVWVQSTDDVTQLRLLLDEYSHETGEQVSLISPLDDTQLASALAGELPTDVLVLDGLEMVPYFARTGYLSEINGLDTGSVFSAPLEKCLIDGLLYCYPWTTNFYALFWNKDQFEAAGLDPETPPETLEQLTDYADRLTRFDLEGQLEQVGFMPDKPARKLWIYPYLHGGFWYSDDLSRLTVNSQQVADALLWESQFYTKYESELMAAFLANAGENPFSNNKAAMMIAPVGTVIPNELRTGVRSIPFPGDASESSGTFLFDGKTIVTPRAADSPRVRKFLEWMVSPEISARVACVEGDFPAIRQGISDPCFSDRLESGNFLPILDSTIGYIRLFTPVSPELETALGQVEDQVFSSGADPYPLLEQIQSQLEVRFVEVMNPR